MDNYLNLENLFTFIALRPFLPVQELCVGKKLKLDKILDLVRNPCLFNLPPQHVHNSAT